MDLTPLVPAGRQIIESYGAGRFRVSGIRFEGSILVFPDRTLGWAVGSCADLGDDSLPEIEAAGRQGSVDVLLLGCGTRMAAVPPSLRTRLRSAGVVTEPMDTGAACRTYNVLMADGRRVAAALIAVE